MTSVNKLHVVRAQSAVSMPSQHPYVRTSNHGLKLKYLSLRKNPFILAWYLYWYGKPFGFRKQGIRSALRECKILVRITIKLFIYRLFSPSPADMIQLPVAGHICVGCKTGYKVFDLRSQTVVKVFYPYVSEGKVILEISRARFAGLHPFAPTVRAWNHQERWYEEEYVNGLPATASNWATYVHSLQNHVVPLISQMFQSGHPRKVSLLVYVDQWREFIESGDRLKSTDLYDSGRAEDMMWSFLETTIDKIRWAGDQPLFLVYAHGSFALEHIISTPHGAVAIDWESSGHHRSALYDVYDNFFRWVRSRRVAGEMAGAIDQAIAQLQLCLRSNMFADGSALIASLSTSGVYRWVYYLEIITSLLSGKRRKTKQESDKALGYINAFSAYEESLPRNASASPLRQRLSNKIGV